MKNQTDGLWVVEWLGEQKKRGALLDYALTMNHSKRLFAGLINGQPHSKIPLQESFSGSAHVMVAVDQRRVASVHLQSLSRQDALASLTWAIQNADAQETEWIVNPRYTYPSGFPVDATLTSLGENAKKGLGTVLRWVSQLDAEASQVEHPRLMNRECGAEIVLTKSKFFDSSGNSVEDATASCFLSISYSLSDTSEYFVDSYCHVPGVSEFKSVAEEAAKNITQGAVGPLEKEDKSSWVVLTPSAFLSLLDDFVFSNLDGQQFIDGTGGFLSDHIGQEIVPGLTLEDNPLQTQSPFSQIFDAEGTPSQSLKLIEKGILCQPLLTKSVKSQLEALYPQLKGRLVLSGHAAGANSTDFTNLRVKFPSISMLPHDKTASELQNYLVVNSFTGFSCDPLTGQFSLDCDGVKVFRNGKLHYSTSLTMRGNFFKTLKQKDNRIGPEKRVSFVTLPSFITRSFSVIAKDIQVG